MTQDEVLKQAFEALKNNRQTHHYCEDTWYSCPKHEEGCANDSEGDECNCGADKANVEIDAAITSLRQAIAELESQESVVDDFFKMIQSRNPKPFSTPQRTESVIDKSAAIRIATALGWSPQHTWVGLTHEEVESYWDWEDFQIGAGRSTILEMVRDIEAKLKEKNGY